MPLPVRIQKARVRWEGLRAAVVLGRNAGVAGRSKVPSIQSLATARVALTIATLITLWMEPGRGVVYSFWLYWLLTVYLAHAVVVMLLVRFRHRSTRAFRLVVHGVDIWWPVLISLFTTSERGPFFLFFVFVMAAAAYRWGLWETVGTAITAVILLWVEGFVVNAGLEQAADALLRATHLP